MGRPASLTPSWASVTASESRSLENMDEAYQVGQMWRKAILFASGAENFPTQAPAPSACCPKALTKASPTNESYFFSEPVGDRFHSLRGPHFAPAMVGHQGFKL